MKDRAGLRFLSLFVPAFVSLLPLAGQSQSPTPGQSIDQVDPNFKLEEGNSACEWIDAFDDRFAIRGLAWLKENQAAKSFRRLPDRAASNLSPAVQGLSLCPSSAFVSFYTDSSLVSVRVSNADAAVMNHMASTGSAGLELYLREGNRWLPVATAIPDTTDYMRDLLTHLPKRMREFRLYLPLYKPLKSLTIGLEQGATTRPSSSPEGGKPIFFYGTSITQGGCANTAGSDFVSILGRTLDTEVINFGFSGSGKGEPEVAELISEVEAEMFVLDYVANAKPMELAKTLPEFVRILRSRHPKTPIVLMGGVFFNRGLSSAENWKTDQEKRDILMDFYLRARKEGDPNLHFIDGYGLLGPGVTAQFVDGIHPTSAGFVQIAERLAPQLTAILIWNRDHAGR